MPSRVIRDGLLDSQAYCSVSIQARELYLHILLLADDCGLMTMAPVFVRRRCFIDAPSEKVIERLFAELASAGLVRTYTHSGGKYLFVPKFGQRLRQNRTKCPPPPLELYKDDLHALKIFKEISAESENLPAVGAQRADSPPPEAKRSEAEVESEFEIEGEAKRAEGLTGLPLASPAAPAPVLLNSQTLAEQLRRQGVTVRSDTDPLIIAWLQDGFDAPHICERSIDIALSRASRPDPLTLPFLDRIVRDEMAQPTQPRPSSNERAAAQWLEKDVTPRAYSAHDSSWQSSWPGIVTKGKEFGLAESEFPHPVAFKQAVYAAADDQLTLSAPA